MNEARIGSTGTGLLFWEKGLLTQKAIPILEYYFLLLDIPQNAY